MLAGDVPSPASEGLFAWNGVNRASVLGIALATGRGDHSLAGGRIFGNPGNAAFQCVPLSACRDSGRSCGHGGRLRA